MSQAFYDGVNALWERGVLKALGEPIPKRLENIYLPFPKPRSYVSKRRWKARYKLGKRIPLAAIVDHRLDFPGGAWDYRDQTLRRHAPVTAPDQKMSQNGHGTKNCASPRAAGRPGVARRP